MNLIRKKKKVLTKSMESLSGSSASSTTNESSFATDFPDVNAFQVGPCAYYVLDFNNNRFLYMDKKIEMITGIPAEEYMNKKPADTIGEAADPTHLESIADFITKSYELLNESRKGDELITSLEHNITTRDGKQKRIISQFYPVVFDKDGKPVINKGRVIDITHIRSEGLPRMFVIGNNKIIYEETALPESVIKGGDLNLTKTEIELAQLLSEGNTTQEIARKMNISVLTVYTHRKNIRNKTGQDINRIISLLKDKGMIK